MLCRESELVVVKYGLKQALQATITCEAIMRPDISKGSHNSALTFVNYLRGFRGADMPQSAEKIGVAVLKKHGVVILSPLSSQDERIRCQFAPSYS